VNESLFEQYKAALRRGHMAALAGELEDALSAYDAAARLVPERALPLASRGTILHRLDRWPEAAEAFDRALQLAPDDEAALRARGSARADRGLRSGAAADFERLAFILDVAGRAAPAAEAARRAADLEPSDAREALATRLGASAAELADLLPGPASGGAAPPTIEDLDQAPTAPEADLADPWSAALDSQRLEGLGDKVVGDAGEAPPAPWTDGAAYDALEALRADLDSGEGEAAATSGEQPRADVEPADAPVNEPVLAVTEENNGGTWPGIDLPSPPPPPIEGPPPDPEDLLSEAALVLERGEVDAARDLMLTAARVHREAGRIDAALEICLNLLSIAPGDPGVHLAIANLQLDRGWTGVATEKIDLLVRLTSLTGDTQAEADVHGLASERLRDDPASITAAH
jgi:tetratricopeptide (TPR) repeat protein